MAMLRIQNQRNPGSLFHYAHFICDCLFTEIINDVTNYEKVVREKTIDQTLGNFGTLYTEITGVENIELSSDIFQTLDTTPITIFGKKEVYEDSENFKKFKKFILNRFPIEPSHDYPEIILIKRGERRELIHDDELRLMNLNVRTGRERREIHGIRHIDEYLQGLFKERYRSVMLEDISFQEQVRLFNQCKMIVCAHGAAMANMFFCQEQTIIVEVTCGAKWAFFDTISSLLNLRHYKCDVNNSDIIMQFIDSMIAKESFLAS